MGTITLENVQPGMVLAKNASDLNGRILLAAGTPLTEKHLRVFRIWGVSEVDIQGIEPDDIAGTSAAHVEPASLSEIEEKVSQIFAFTNKSHPAIAELMRLAVQRLVRRISEGTNEHE